MVRRFLIPMALMISIPFLGSAAFSGPSLHDWAFHINGDIYKRSFPAFSDFSSFDQATGLGTIVIHFESGLAGDYSFIAFFDHEMDETENGFTNEFGEAVGTPAAGQSWEIDEPGYRFGNIYSHVQGGSLDGTNGVPETAKDDVSLGLGWNFSLTSTDRGRISLFITQNAGEIPPGFFYLRHVDPESNQTLYFYGQLEVRSITTPYTVTTDPTGLQIVVDGSTFTAPITLDWVAGSTHTLSVTSPQAELDGSRYAFSSWSDGGAQSHTITAPFGNTTYTAFFTVQYRLMTSVNPSGTGTVTPAGTNWYDGGQTVSVQATPNSGYYFSGWSGDLSGLENPTSILMDGPKAVTANFAPICPVPGTPSEPSPEDGATGVSMVPTLRWAACANTDFYEVSLGTTPGPPLVGVTTEPSYIPDALNPNRTYYWKVTAKNNCGNSSEGKLWSFTVSHFPVNDEIVATSIQGRRMHFMTTYHDELGHEHITEVRFKMAVRPTGHPEVILTYDKVTNLISMEEDGEKTGRQCRPGEGKNLRGRYLTLYCSKTNVVGAEDSLKVQWLVKARKAFAGIKDLSLFVTDVINATDGWDLYGTWESN